VTQAAGTAATAIFCRFAIGILAKQAILVRDAVVNARVACATLLDTLFVPVLQRRQPW
jgi:hypothetical protein